MGVLVHIPRRESISVPAFPAKVLGTVAWINLRRTFTPNDPLDTQIRFGRLPWDERDPRTEIGEVNLVHGSLGSDQQMLSHFNRLCFSASHNLLRLSLMWKGSALCLLGIFILEKIKGTNQSLGHRLASAESGKFSCRHITNKVLQGLQFLSIHCPSLQFYLKK